MISKISKKYKLKSKGPTSQRKFLIKLGILLRAENLIKNADIKQKRMIKNSLSFLIDKNKMGEIFNVILINNKNINNLIGF